MSRMARVFVLMSVLVVPGTAGADILLRTTFDNGTVQSINGTNRFIFNDLASTKMYPSCSDTQGPAQLQPDTPFGVGYSFQSSTEPSNGGGIIRNEVNTLIIQNAFTIEAWIKPTKLTFDNGTGAGFSIFRIDLESDNASGWSKINLNVTANGALYVEFIKTGSAWKSTKTDNSTIPANAWTHVAAVYDRDNDQYLRLYVNGSEVTTARLAVGTYPNWNNVNFKNSSSFNTLAQANTSGSYGYIDDLLLANHGRTDADILADAQASFTSAMVKTPAISPDGGVYDSNTSATITCGSAGATIRYTTDGTDPLDTSAVYSAPITVDRSMVLKAKAFADGLAPSAVKASSFQIKKILLKTTFDDVSTQQLILGYNRYIFPDLVGAKLYPFVTVGGTNGTNQLQADTPFGAGKSYQSTGEPINGGILRNEANTMIIQNAFTIEAWIKPTKYTLDNGTVCGFSIFQIRPTGPSGSNEWSTINFLVDSAAATAGQLYAQFIRTGSAWQNVYSGASHLIATNAWTHVAVVYNRDNDHTMRLYINGTQVAATNVGTYPDWSSVNFRNSGNCNTLGGAVTSGSYGLIDDLLLANFGRTDAEIAYDVAHSFSEAVVASPTFSLSGGSYTEPQTVTINCATAGATIRYTTDGTDPTTSSPAIANGGTVAVNGTMTLKAKAWKTAMLDSAIARADYVLARPLWLPYSTGVTVDGSLSDWSDAAWAPLDQVYYAPTYYSNDTDAQAWYAVKWKADKVYVAVKVQDNNLVFTDTYDAWNTRDAVEIFLHTTGTGPATYGLTQADAQQYTLGFKTDFSTLWSVIGGNQPIPSQANFQAAGTISGNWLYYEVALTPYQTFSISGSGLVVSPLSAGQVIGVDVVVDTIYNGEGDFMCLSENLLTGKYNDYTKIGLHKLVRTFTNADLAAVLAAMDSKTGGPGWNASVDLDNDGEITSTDLGIVLANLP